MTLDEIKTKYGVAQNDKASGSLGEAFVAIQYACSNAKKALQKATKWTNDPKLKILQPKLQAAFNAIDDFNGAAGAINTKSVKL